MCVCVCCHVRTYVRCARAVGRFHKRVAVAHSPACSDADCRRACYFPADCSCGGRPCTVAWIQVSNSLDCHAGSNGVCPDGNPCAVTALDAQTQCE